MFVDTICASFQLLMGKIPEPHLENSGFLDPEGSKKPFAPHYERFIKPEIHAFEHKRIAALKTVRQRVFCSLCLIVAIVVMGKIFMAQSSNQDVVSKIILLIISLVLIWCYVPIRRYKSDVKKTIFPHIFSFFGDDFHYDPEAEVGIDHLKPSEILPAYDGANLSDSVRGSYENVNLNILCAHLYLKKRDRKETRTITVFDGLFILLSMNKRFLGKTIVKRDRGLMNWANKPPEELEKVNLEDPRFEADFEVYASNQIEARYLLTPSFMERLQGLSNLFGGADIQASFYNQNLLLMIPLKKRYFSTGSIFQPATFTEEIQSILEEMNLIFKIIEELKLHEKTGV
jgi:hypothetical protein